jgi:hypothetical protein
MATSCVQCGAVFPVDEICQGRFDACLALEFTQPAYGAVHHLTVPCYMLQHNAYSRAGWIEARKLLAKFVQDGWMPAQARRQARGVIDSGNRTWHVTKGDKLPGVESIAWSFTLAQVRLETADLYCADVLQWARSILTDSQPFLIELF